MTAPTPQHILRPDSQHMAAAGRAMGVDAGPLARALEVEVDTELLRAAAEAAAGRLLEESGRRGVTVRCTKLGLDTETSSDRYFTWCATRWSFSRRGWVRSSSATSQATGALVVDDGEEVRLLLVGQRLQRGGRGWWSRLGLRGRPALRSAASALVGGAIALETCPGLLDAVAAANLQMRTTQWVRGQGVRGDGHRHVEAELRDLLVEAARVRGGGSALAALAQGWQGSIAELFDTAARLDAPAA